MLGLRILKRGDEEQRDKKAYEQMTKFPLLQALGLYLLGGGGVVYVYSISRDKYNKEVPKLYR